MKPFVLLSIWKYCSQMEITGAWEWGNTGAILTEFCTDSLQILGSHFTSSSTQYTRDSSQELLMTRLKKQIGDQ